MQGFKYISAFALNELWKCTYIMLERGNIMNFGNLYEKALKKLKEIKTVNQIIVVLL